MPKGNAIIALSNKGKEVKRCAEKERKPDGNSVYYSGDAAVIGVLDSAGDLFGRTEFYELGYDVRRYQIHGI